MRRWLCVSWLLFLGLAQCGGKANADGSGTSATAVGECERDAECTAGRCICGYCTEQCDSTRDCTGWQDAECRPASDVGCTREDTLCLPRGVMAPGAGGGGPGVAPSMVAPDLIPSPDADDDVDPEPEPAPTEPSVDLPACRELAASEEGLASGNALVDEHLKRVEAVGSKTEALTTESAMLFAELASALGSTDAAPEAVVLAYETWKGESSVPDLSLLMWPARCPLSVNDVVLAMSVCDPELVPSDSLDCQGACLLPEGSTCAAGSTECRIASPNACQGFCEGSCEVALSATGSCDGACSGTCVLVSETECDVGTVACRSDGETALPCTTECEGTLAAPSAVAGCGPVAQATVWLDVACEATAVPLYTGGSDAGAPSAEFSSSLDTFVALVARALELNETATLTLQAAAVLNGALGDVEAAAEESECAAVLIDQAPVTLGTAGADIDLVMVDTSTFIAGIQ